MTNLIEDHRGRRRHPLGTASQLYSDIRQRQLAELRGYEVKLDNMEYHEAASATGILNEIGYTTFANPAGYLTFETAESRLTAIELLQAIKPLQFEHKWRALIDVYPYPAMTPRAHAEWVRTHPVKEKYLIGTSKDPDRGRADLITVGELFGMINRSSYNEVVTAFGHTLKGFQDFVGCEIARTGAELEWALSTISAGRAI